MVEKMVEVSTAHTLTSHPNAPSRVTGFGEFSPVQLFLSVGDFTKIL
jgi:hypothetical protein